MKLFRFAKIPRHQQFNYVPRFYDPKKEQLEEAAKRVKEIQEGGVDGMKDRISGSFKGRKSGRLNKDYVSQLSRQRKRSNWIILAIIVVLCVVVYQFFIKTWPVMIEAFNLNGTPG
jgi:hypothetical protein